MKASWEVWLSDQRGQRVRLVDNALEWYTVHNANNVGGFGLVVPYDQAARDFILDSIVEFWRKPYGGVMRLENLGFVRRFAYSQGSAGETLLSVSGPDMLDLLRRRIVAYAAGSAYANKSNQADDMMRDIVRENLGANATDTARDLTAYGLTVEADLSLGASVDKAFSRAKVLDTLRDIADASAQAGTDLYFTLAPSWSSSGYLQLLFRVRSNWLGADRVNVGSPVVFGQEWGNLSSPELVYDYGDELTYVYAGGQGEEDNRYVYGVEDTTRSGKSVWNRREGWVDARTCTSEAEVQSRAKSALEDGKPTMRFSGILLDGENTRYGLEWEFGDWVSCSFAGAQFDGMVKATAISVDGQGNETIEARFEVEQ